MSLENTTHPMAMHTLLFNARLTRDPHLLCTGATEAKSLTTPVTPIFQVRSTQRSATQRTLQGGTEILSRALERVLEKIQAFSADFDERVKANVLRTGAEVVAQLLHSDIRPGSLKAG